MSFVDLATLTMHRRNELEGRINIFTEKCDHAVKEIKKLKRMSQGFVRQLNCEPSELKDRFLSCMKRIDEYMYLLTDFNLAMAKLDDAAGSDFTPVHDTTRTMVQSLSPFNLMDALTEPVPSTSTSCQNQCPPNENKRKKVPKEEQKLIMFSSSSCSSESMQVKSEPKGQCGVVEDMKNLTIGETSSPLHADPCSLPGQSVLEIDTQYPAVIMYVDGAFFWVITDDFEEVLSIMTEMTEFYNRNYTQMSLEEVESLTCCAFYDSESDCFYRGLFVKLDENKSTAEVYAVDMGETRTTPINNIQPLAAQFRVKPPYARCCHLAGFDPASYDNKEFMAKQEEYMKCFVGERCTIEVDDNSSESLGVYVILPSKETLNHVLVQRGWAIPIEKSSSSEPAVAPTQGPPELVNSELDILNCPEYEDPVQAVTGYHNRDEADICKHYKGGAEKTCFKGSRCNKKHITKHPEGWTLDRMEVVGKCKSLPLPAPDTWLRVLVTCVCHFDRVYVQFVNETPMEQVPSFGVVLPPVTLEALVRDMNSPATRLAYKPLAITPAPGELVAAFYPADENWYRARVSSISRADQSVEVIYIDYGTVMWVKEDQIRILEPRFVSLPMQAVRCVIAGVQKKSHSSQQWAAAKNALTHIALDKMLNAHVIARDYDEITVELYDDDGASIADQLAATNLVELHDYTVIPDANVTQKLVVP